MKAFAGYRAKTFSYLRYSKKCVIKRKPRLNDYEDCLLNNRIILKPH